MAQTSDAYFLSANQAAPGTEVWDSLNNLLALAGEASTSGLSSSQATQTVSLNDPANSGEIGPSDTITDIRVRVRAYYVGAGSAEISIVNLQIAGGNIQAPVQIAEDIETTYTYDGDLTYWGITEQQARDFVDALEDLDFQLGHVGGANSTKDAVVWVDVRFDYTEFVNPLVNLPTIF